MNITSTTTSTAVDSYLWSLSTGTGELDYLRGIHRLKGVQAIKIYLRLHYNAITRVSSIWLDKYPIAQPTARSGCNTQRRELGDLAIVVRQSYPNRVEIRMWILQAKVYSPGWTAKGSSKKEIELYERVPEFDLYSSAHAGARSLGTFDLQQHFPLSQLAQFRFWSYLFFEPTLKSNAISPIRAHWSALSVQWQNSFVGAVGLIAAPKSPLRNDTIVEPQKHAEWTRLYHALWNYASNRAPSRLPSGPWIHHAFLDPGNDPSGGVKTYEVESPDGEIALASTGFWDPDWKDDDLQKKAAIFAKNIIDLPPPNSPLPDGGDNEDGGPGIKMVVIDQIFSDNEPNSD